MTLDEVSQRALVRFLLARIDEDITTALDDAGPRLGRALANAGAKQTLVEMHEPSHEFSGIGDVPVICIHCAHDWPCPTLLVIAAIYIAHPDYRTEWIRR